MTKQDLRIIFIGTPDFAVATLSALFANNYNIVAVITAPDKAAGRGLQLQQSAVKQIAVAHNIAVLQPTNLKDVTFLETLKSYNANLQIVVAFRMLPEAVWNMPSYGTFNVHASLLPNYRGAAPINWAIINGEKTTGVSTFKLQHIIDTGNILVQKEIAITDTDNATTLHDNLMQLGATAMLETLEALVNNTLSETVQNNLDASLLKHAPKIFTDTCVINWQQNAKAIFNFIRGLSPQPCATSILHEKKLKIFSSVITNTSCTHLPAGTFESDNKTYLRIATQDYYLDILDLQLEGKKRMLVQDFLRGYQKF